MNIPNVHIKKTETSATAEESLRLYINVKSSLKQGRERYRKLSVLSKLHKEVKEMSDMQYVQEESCLVRESKADVNRVEEEFLLCTSRQLII